MVTKKRSGSERVQSGSRGYLAIERARQDAFSSHPKGMALPGLRFAEALDRALRPALPTSPSAASRRSHVTALAGNSSSPSGDKRRRRKPKLEKSLPTALLGERNRRALLVLLRVGWSLARLRRRGRLGLRNRRGRVRERGVDL